jgi:AcrR family transcriptional regulator
MKPKLKKSKPKKHQPLSVQRIAICALKIADKKGLDQLSMRSIATLLGVEAMSLYYHVPSKASLMEAMVEQIVGKLDTIQPSADWHETLTRVAQQWRSLALAHPGAFPLLATRGQTSPLLFERYATLLAMLIKAGLTPEDAASALSSFFYALNGYLLAAGAPVVFHEVPEPSSFPAMNPEAASVFALVPNSVWDLTSEATFMRHLNFLLDAVAASLSLCRSEK